METTIENVIEQTSKIELRLNSQRFKMVIPANVEEKIRFACASVPNKEWSGVLFYSFAGTFENNNFTATCKDILVMDIGTSAYTEWCADADVIRYMAENELLDCQLGIVHSHNSMKAFFSGTDTATLLTEGQDRNNIVSLIVNNAGVYEAAVTRLVTTKSSVQEEGSYEFFNKGTEHYTDEYTSEDIYVEYFMFDIIKKESRRLNSFMGRLQEIMHNKTKVSRNKSSYVSPYSNVSTLNKYDNKKLTSIKDLYDDAAPQSSYRYAEDYYPRDFYPANTSVLPLWEENDDDIRVKHPNAKKKSSAVSSLLNASVEDKFIENLALQLVTGNVLADVSSGISLDKWVKKDMSKAFLKRFGKDDSKQSTFENWKTSMIEFLLYYSEDKDLRGFSMTDRGAIIAEYIYDRLVKIGSTNYYLTSILDSLKYYYDI